jgi:hypothetical protein
MPETGQHISLFSFDSLKFIALKYNLNLYSNGKTLHLLTDKKINKYLFRLFCKVRFSILLDMIIPKKSLLMSDYDNIKK